MQIHNKFTNGNVLERSKLGSLLLSGCLLLFILVHSLPQSAFVSAETATTDSVNFEHSIGRLFGQQQLHSNSGAASLTFQSIVTGLTLPVDIAHAGDERLFIVEKPGRIRIVDSSGTLLTTPFLDITALVDDSANEQGLLGLVFHPDYADNGYFYLNYTYDPGAGLDRTRIVRYEVSSGDPNLANAGSGTIIMEVEQPYSNHNGGDLAFGLDGYLYIGMGDGGSGGDPDNYSQSYDQLLGKLLRIDINSTGGVDCDVSGHNNYAIPATNPFAGPDGICDEIWSGGLRNPWRFSVDRDTGDLWISDVGQNAWEEINYQPVTSPGGENWGWRCYEGSQPYNLTGCGPSTAYDFPVHDYPHDFATGGYSVIGGFVYRGSDILALNGHYLFSDYVTEKYWSLSGPSHTLTVFSASGISGKPLSFGEDVAGEIYVATNSGTIYKMIDVTLPCMSETAVVVLPFIVNDNGNVRLNWTDNAANLGGYAIHRSPTPYFTPDGSTLETSLPNGSETYLDTSSGIGDSANNYSYIVQSRNCNASLTANSGELGEFDFGLVSN